MNIWTNSLLNGLAIAVIVLAIGTVVNAYRVAKRRKRALELVGVSRVEFEVYKETTLTRLQRLAEASIRLTPKVLQDVTAQQLTRAGFYGGTPRLLLLSIEILLVLAFVLTLFTSFGQGPLTLLILIFGSLFVFTPRAFLLIQSEIRSNQLSRELPNLVDLMLLVVSGGLGLTAAMEKVVKTQTGLLAGELVRTLDDLKLGVNRVDAFSNLVERTGSSEVRRFADAIMKVDQLGVSLTTVLRAQAAEMRHRNRVEARERAQRISVKILFPLILCFLPGLFIVVIGPAVIDIISSLAR
ncbi:MAG: type II secretion system F family protein [Aquiluna sp.]|nr:type II secretion system F family protein [Aquiluna sp.]MCF8546211.1 type II secretion system F family protein [Aquiluna sp.]